MMDNIIPMAWSPLGGGALPEELMKTLTAMAAEFGVSPQVLAIAWLLQHPSGILPVTGTTKMERLTEVKEALNLQLDRQQWYTIYQASTGKSLP
jgi:predicted oxidoreductase